MAFWFRRCGFIDSVCFDGDLLTMAFWVKETKSQAFSVGKERKRIGTWNWRYVCIQARRG